MPTGVRQWMLWCPQCGQLGYQQVTSAQLSRLYDAHQRSCPQRVKRDAQAASASEEPASPPAS